MNGTIRLVRDWEAVRAKIGKESWAEQIVVKAKTDTDRWIAAYEDDAGRVAGWGHHYFCAHCFASLIFDPQKPEEHVCSSCGIVRNDQEANDAWCYIFRTSACSQVFQAAALYNIYGDESYLAYIRKAVNFLSDHYGTFGVRTPPNQEGRFSGTDLTDGVAVIWLLNGLELVRDRLTAEELGRWKERFFIPEAAFLIEKVGVTPNIICWMKAAAGMIGLFFDEPVWCERAAEGEYGIKKKLNDGLLKSGVWYEGSFHYHFYCAEGLTYYLAFCKIYGYDFPEMEDALLRMYRYPVPFSFANGQFPSPNDGWPLLGFRNYAQQYEWIRNVYDEAPFRYALAQCYDEPGAAKGSDPAPNVGGMARLLFGSSWRQDWEANPQSGEGLPDGQSVCDPNMYFAMLRSGDASVFLKYGFILRGHSHADIMNFELFLKDELLSRDISNSGYGSDLFREWQRKTIAHNSLMIDRQNQPNRPHGQLLSFDRENNAIHAAADDVYPGFRFERSLRLQPDRLHDAFTVKPSPGTEGLAGAQGQVQVGAGVQVPTGAVAGSSDVHVFDWFFHCSGELKHELPMEPAERPGDADGYQLMLDTACCRVDGDWEISWELSDKTLTLHMADSPGTTVYVFRGYEHRLDWTRWGVMVRREGAEAAFNAEYRFAVK